MHLNTLQKRIKEWVTNTFGEDHHTKKLERCHRFLEESLELCQACDMPKEDVLTLLEYVYNRPKGLVGQEVGGVLVTLAALCNSHNTNMSAESEIEYSRILEKSEEIREKQLKKPFNSPLPQ